MQEAATLDAQDGFPPEWRERWHAAHGRIDQAGYGALVADAYRRAGPALAAHAGPAFAVRLASAVSQVAIRAGRLTASRVPQAALVAARHFDEVAMNAWAAAVEDVARRAPEAALPLLENTGRLTQALAAADFTAFVRMGLHLGDKDKARRRAFFALESSDAIRLVEGHRVDTGLAAWRHGLGLYLNALWGIAPPIAEAPTDAPEQMRRRPGFGGGGVRLPAGFSGFEGAEAKLLYRAAVAHIGAHHRFTRAKFPVAGLKPLQIALVSLIEDARVERLAAQQMPGLASLWRRFHVARPEGPPVAIALMARLSRALADPDYIDPHGWVEKGRTLFAEAVSEEIGEQQFSRRIGGLLGNDIGQMRLQFDAKTYVVQPAYRDDNMGIWDFGPDDSQAPVEIEAMLEGARIEQQAGDDGRREQGEDGETATGRLTEARDDGDRVVARYPEYDHVTGRYRPEWCHVREMPGQTGSAAMVTTLSEVRSDLVDRLAALIKASRISRQQRVRGRTEGEFLDMDASIAAMIARRAGEVPDTRVYGRYERRSRDMSVLVLIDSSRSTTERVRGSQSSVLDMERLSTALLARAMTNAGDPFAIAAFCSNGREDVRYQRIKDFNHAFDRLALARLAGITGEYSTRLGTVIRHAGNDLRRQRSHRRLLLIVTDGEPSDVDVDDRRYLVEDARMAVHELGRSGIDTFCVALDSEADSYAQRIFGSRGVALIDSIDRLDKFLPAVYLRLRS
ncbi:VWA domain-containing protein [Shinella sp. CPCC 101442]|uniref:nitric oxide reductase activation protein NorD n=1 Tax=Shinella sp. CPCC 101442 TaxID=2932265 RepID=UPI00215249B4|nr:VWA domain-containing protein [Shinella sp. CPCC 101442]MCR6502905.1 VWA domain-containing protein [Shinella sp. CPCC 101442]